MCVGLGVSSLLPLGLGQRCWLRRFVLAMTFLGSSVPRGRASLSASLSEASDGAERPRGGLGRVLGCGGERRVMALGVKPSAGSLPVPPFSGVPGTAMESLILLFAACVVGLFGCGVVVDKSVTPK